MQLGFIGAVPELVARIPPEQGKQAIAHRNERHLVTESNQGIGKRLKVGASSRSVVVLRDEHDPLRIALER
jgi:hypothetical protein